MIVEHSYGVVPLHKDKDGHIEILVVKGAGYRGFPKGHIEAGETPVEAALRELQEETGITKAMINEHKMFKDHYIFTQKNRVIGKHVGYFMAYTPDKRVVLDKRELSSYRWLSLSGARELLTYDSAKQILDTVALEVGIIKFT